MNTKFSYKWYSRFTGIFLAFGYFLFGIVVSIRAAIYKANPELGEILFLWSILSFLMLVSFVFGRKTLIALRPVEISNEGVKGNFQSRSKFWPEPNPGFVEWSDIEKLEAFGYPDMDSLGMYGKAGVRIISRDGNKIVIYQHIQQYGELLSKIRSGLDKVK